MKSSSPAPAGKPSALLDTRVIYCVPSPGTPGEGWVGACLEQLRNLPAACIDLIYIDYMRPRCVECLSPAGGRDG